MTWFVSRVKELCTRSKRRYHYPRDHIHTLGCISPYPDSSSQLSLPSCLLSIFCVSHFSLFFFPATPSDICKSGTCYLLSALNMPRMCYGANFQIYQWKFSLCEEKKEKENLWCCGEKNINICSKYDISLCSFPPQCIPNCSMIQVERSLTVAMRHALNSAKKTYINNNLRSCFSSLCTCILHTFSPTCRGRRESNDSVFFIFHPPRYSNDLTLLSLLGNDDDAYQFHRLAETRVHYPVAYKWSFCV